MILWLIRTSAVMVAISVDVIYRFFNLLESISSFFVFFAFVRALFFLFLLISFLLFVFHFIYLVFLMVSFPCLFSRSILYLSQNFVLGFSGLSIDLHLMQTCEIFYFLFDIPLWATGMTCLDNLGIA